MASQINPWPFGLLGVLVGTAVVCAIVLSIASTHPSSFIDTAAWEHGQKYEIDIAKQRVLGANGIRHEVEIAGSQISLRLLDKDNEPVRSLAITLTLEYAASDTSDQKLRLAEVAPGTYRAKFSGETGTWFMKFSGTLNGNDFEIRETRVL